MPGLDLTFLNNTTRDHFIRVLKNNIYNKRPLYNRLLAKGRIKTATGTSLSWDVVAKRHAAVGLFTGYDVMANQPINPTVRASLPVSGYYATLAISGTEERLNTGNEERLIDMLKTQTQNAQETLQELLTGGVYGNGALIGNRQPIIGLGAAIANDNTYANIDRTQAANAFWRANIDATQYDTTTLTNPGDNDYLPALMRASYLSATHNEAPDLIVVTKNIYALYQNIAENQHLRFNNEIANLGFGGVEFQAGIALIFDDYCTANAMYFLRLDDWTVWVYPGADLDMQEEGWLKPTDQDARVTHILWQGQLRLDSPWQQAALTGLQLPN